MAIESDNAIMLIGFIIVLIVGLNMIFVFGNIAEPSLTGAVVANEPSCSTTGDGIVCGETLYPKTPATGLCPGGFVPVCTNACKVEAALMNKEPSCASTCTTVCVSANIARKL